MPFTLSHSAAVLPLLRCKRLDPAALVIGSMAPDVGYFIGRFDIAWRAHTLGGSVTHALPLACILWFLCRCLAAPLAAPLPEPWRRETRGALGRRLHFPVDLVRIPLSAWLGIGTHNGIDSFTHASGWSVVRIPILHAPWPLYNVLQHLGSLAGLSVLFMLWKRSASSETVKKSGILLVALAFISVMIASVLMAEAFVAADGPLRWKVLIFRTVVTMVTISVAAYMIWGLFLVAARGWKKSGGS